MTTGARTNHRAIARRAAPLIGPAAAILLGIAAGFFVWAVPAAVIGRAFAPALVGGQVVLALVVALICGAATWAGFAWLDRPARPPRAALPAPSREAAPVLRRADAHPDAPSRRPIFAGSDLGTPLDLIDPDAVVGEEDRVTAIRPTPLPPVVEDEAIIADADAPAGEGIVAETVAEPVAPAVAATGQAVAPMPDAPPAALLPLPAMMARLEAGLVRKALTLAGAEPNVTPLRREIRPVAGSLTAAVEELRQRTARRR